MFHAETKFSPADFWKLVELFSNLDKTKAYVAEVKEAQALLVKEQSDFAQKLKDFWAEKEAVQNTAAKLAEAKVAFDAKKAAEMDKIAELNSKLNDHAHELESQRLYLNSLGDGLKSKEAELKALKEALDTQAAQADNLHNQRVAELKAREEMLAEKEAAYTARLEALNNSLKTLRG